VQGVKALLDRIARSKDMFFVNLGDTVDAICSDDKRFHCSPNGNPLPVQQCEAAVKLFAPAARRCWAWLNGNHEEKLHRFGEIARDLMAVPLNVPYGGYACKLELRDKFGLLFKLYLWHGPIRGSVHSNAKDYTQRQANMKASVRRYLENKATDCAIMAHAHVHKLLVAEPAPKLMIADDGDKLTSGYLPPPEAGETYLEPDRRWYVSTGSYLKSQVLGSDSYAELAGYDPIELGHAEIVVEDRQIVTIKRVVSA
jgi:hypothetical protein